MDKDRKIAPLDESSTRQILVGWGASVVCTALAFLVSGILIPCLLLFIGLTIALRGHRPAVFAKHIDAQFIAGTPYRREESIRAWTGAVLICLLLAFTSYLLHRKLVPANPDITKTIIEGVKKVIESQQKVAISPTPPVSVPPRANNELRSAPKPTFTEAPRDFVVIAGGSGHQYHVNKSSTVAAPSRVTLFGEAVPALSVYIERDRLYVDTQLYYAPDKPPLQLVHNQLKNRPLEWDSNFDESAVEIVDENGKPRFQFIYNDPHTASLRGIFQFENRVVVLEEKNRRFAVGSSQAEMETGPIFKYPSRRYLNQELPGGGKQVSSAPTVDKK